MGLMAPNSAQLPTYRLVDEPVSSAAPRKLGRDPFDDTEPLNLAPLRRAPIHIDGNGCSRRDPGPAIGALIKVLSAVAVLGTLWRLLH